MSPQLLLRRSLVSLGVIAALLTGVATIRAAAAWTAASAPLEVEPGSVARLQAALAAEQDRSAALQGQIDALSASSADLAAALEAARGRIVSDGDAAAELSASLASAEAKLRQLEASLAAARRGQGAQLTAGGAAPAPAITPEPR